jgi:hypothetical protein
MIERGHPSVPTEMTAQIIHLPSDYSHLSPHQPSVQAIDNMMESPEDLPDSYDLTGKVVLTDPVARFNGNYSWVFEGTLRGKPVCLFVEKVIPTNLLLNKLSRWQSRSSG